MKTQPISEEHAHLVEIAQLRITAQRLRLQQQIQNRKAAEHYGVMPRET